MICRPAGVTRRAQLLVMVLGALQAGVVAAAVRRREVRVPQVLSPRTLGTGVEEPFPLGLLHANLGVPHPSSYLHRRGEGRGRGGGFCVKSSTSKQIRVLISLVFLAFFLIIRVCSPSARAGAPETHARAARWLCQLLFDRRKKRF